jgi:hypothetical protein
MTYIGYTVMLNEEITAHGWDAAIVLAEQNRFNEHVAAKKSRSERMIQKVGPSNVKRTVVYSGLYNSRRTAEADETYFINQIPPVNSLNDRQRVNAVLNKKHQTKLIRSEIKVNIIRKDCILPKISSKTKVHWGIVYYDKDSRNCKQVKKSVKHGRDGIDCDDRTLKKRCLEIVERFYTPNMFPANDPVAYIENQLVSYRQ